MTRSLPNPATPFVDDRFGMGTQSAANERVMKGRTLVILIERHDWEPSGCNHVSLLATSGGSRAQFISKLEGAAWSTVANSRFHSLTLDE